VVGATAALTAAHGLVSIARNRNKKAGDEKTEKKSTEKKKPVKDES
jgi:hypothetical protein